MFKEVLAIFLASALLGETVTAMKPLAAGRCKHRCNITSNVPINLAFFQKYKPFKVIYATGKAPFMNKIIKVERDGCKINDTMYLTTDTMIMNDKSKGEYKFMMYVIDNVIIEETINENGKRKLYYSHPLALTMEAGLLFHRCTDDDDDDDDDEVDTRFIWLPSNHTLSEEGLKYIKDNDARCNFRGKLYKLPETN